MMSPFISNTTFSSEMPRQLLPKSYRLTGGFYCIDVEEMLKHEKVIPSKSIGFPTKMYPNIDSEDDFKYITWLIERKQNLPRDFLKIINSSS